ncbi:hypothetical protein BO70DRAFT_10724 [Aspergillus heteromorphus CBS 117.55]|uniref:Uncharacterized protein n=1 Tax=Aspergillus heteromorphus CBS 117.55 TaxID=1448321 RepID=A0A317X781_9EURO|nr:uncharacterized protein BO70DRAFT_10724 [Aspergillus heteromorphus CBS 117.55]PWY92450.1 hypothetical protein BO70DRAFT_10724 [Aspergillus heteromorphus CBS 117.55]
MLSLRLGSREPSGGGWRFWWFPVLVRRSWAFFFFDTHEGGKGWKGGGEGGVESWELELELERERKRERERERERKS